MEVPRLGKQIGATAASLRRSHVGSKLRLWPRPQLTARPGGILMDTSQIPFCCTTTGTPQPLFLGSRDEAGFEGWCFSCCLHTQNLQRCANHSPALAPSRPLSPVLRPCPCLLLPLQLSPPRARVLLLLLQPRKPFSSQAQLPGLGSWVRADPWPGLKLLGVPTSVPAKQDPCPLLSGEWTVRSAKSKLEGGSGGELGGCPGPRASFFRDSSALWLPRSYAHSAPQGPC